MTGWRVGFLCAPKEICDAALKIHQYVMLCAPVMGQIGALEALRSAEDEKTSMVNDNRLRRNMFVPASTGSAYHAMYPREHSTRFPR